MHVKGANTNLSMGKIDTIESPTEKGWAPICYKGFAYRKGEIEKGEKGGVGTVRKGQTLRLYRKET